MPATAPVIDTTQDPSGTYVPSYGLSGLPRIGSLALPGMELPSPDADESDDAMGDVGTTGGDDNDAGLRVPTDDQDAAQLVVQAKKVLDAHDALPQNQQPQNQAAYAAERQKYVDAVSDALHAYHDAAKTPFSAAVVQGVRSDPKLSLSDPPEVDEGELAQLAAQHSAAPMPTSDSDADTDSDGTSGYRISGADLSNLTPVSGAYLPGDPGYTPPANPASTSNYSFPVKFDLPGLTGISLFPQAAAAMTAPPDYRPPATTQSIPNYLPNRTAAAAQPDQASAPSYDPSLIQERGYYSKTPNPQTGRYDFIHDDTATTARTVPQSVAATPSKPLTPYQQANVAIRQQGLNLRQQQQQRLAAQGAKTPADSARRLSADLQALTGHSLDEFTNTGASDTHQVPGGVMFMMGDGDDDSQKEPVFLSQDKYNTFIGRFNGLYGGGNTAQGSSASAPPQPMASTQPPPAGTQPPQPTATAASTQDQQAAAWAMANPNDPRAAKIKAKLGLQ